MTLGEKSAAITGGDSSDLQSANQRFEDQRPANQKIADQRLSPPIMNREEADYSFSDVVEKACEGLMNRQINFSIRRIKMMEERLCGLEQELDAFLNSRVRN